MANYSLVVNSVFKPYSYQELLAPVQMATQAHQDLENQYSELSTKASVWENLANEQTDPYAYNMYKTYANELEMQAEQLAREGLNPLSRKNLIGMRNRYSKEITPIEQAYNKKQELIKQQREALLKDDTLMFDIDYSTSSLDNLINNPSATYTPLSGASIAKRTSEMAKEAAGVILSNPEYKSVYDKQYVQQKIMQGYDMSQIIAAAQRDPNAPKELLGIVDTIKKQVGYDKWSADNQIKIDNYINQGLNDAVGTPKIDIISNRDFKSEIDEERLQLAKDQFEYEKLGVKQSDGSYYKPLGGGIILHTKPDGTSVIIGAPSNEKEEIKAQKELEKELSKVVKVSDMKGKGFTPVGAVIKSGDEWISGVEGADIPDKWRGHNVKTNLKSGSNWWPFTWGSGSGDFSYNPRDPHTEATIVNNMETIPGFKEWAEGSGDLSEIDESTAFGQIVKQARLAGISDEEFQTNNVRILKVKSTGSRISSEEPYDYIIYRKS